VARRESRAEQYAAVAAFYGSGLLQDLHDPRVPDFVIVHGARRAGHYALTALRLFEKRQAAAATRGVRNRTASGRYADPVVQVA
jgi:hypothetical protein